MNSRKSEDRGVLSRLSLAAMRSAAALDDDDVARLFDHLYSYNSIPPSRRWLELYPDKDGVRGELGLDSSSAVWELLAGRWVQLSDGRDGDWLMWGTPHAGGELGGAGADFKLYVSPAIDALETVFPEAVRVATFGHADYLKIGADVTNLLRPDKLVVYFSSMEDLVHAAHEMARRLDGVPAHGVPFTAEISGDGLLSWGRDPPNHPSPSGRHGGSWREWICRRLAAALADSRSEADSTQPRWLRALNRLRAEGFDTDRWSPKPAFWRSAPW